MAFVGVRSSAARAHDLLSGAGSNPGLLNLSSVGTMPHALYNVAILSRPSILRTI